MSFGCFTRRIILRIEVAFWVSFFLFHRSDRQGMGMGQNWVPQELLVNMKHILYIYIYIYVCIYVCIYIYISG